ncbi:MULTISPECIES: gamma carbonic anhydrase family protein [unclassified Streptomyces]|uniref:gamma carbonic anhydrase family protein n=1 Tax=unclassified Streptomyces TaxID=2593676 RepID=UPI0007DCF558|nr:gamma carbonic anhydrase family protein [Streptomyces sp. SAT1]ANH90474.1 gamma carbonic anhydrase family protein [Streptomyces sp. SAT1]
MTREALVMGIGGREPQVDAEAFVAPSASVIGEVVLGAGASVWYGAVLRGDVERIAVGADSNVQDNCTLHADPTFPVSVGARVSVGHNAVVHGATVEDDCLIGMGATVLNGAVIGAGSLVAAQALVPQGMRVPPGSLVAGVPAKVRRELTEEERQGITLNGTMYAELAKAHRDAHTHRDAHARREPAGGAEG